MDGASWWIVREFAYFGRHIWDKYLAMGTAPLRDIGGTVSTDSYGSTGERVLFSGIAVGYAAAGYFNS